MSSAERTFQTHIVANSGSQIGGDNSKYQSESTQQIPPKEVALHAPQNIEVAKPYSSAILGLTPELTKETFTDNPSLLSEKSTLDINQIRAKRREQFEQTGFVPPIAGGSPRKITISPEELVSLNRDHHISVPKLAERFGVSETTIYKTLDAGGFDKEARKLRLEEEGYISLSEDGAPVKVLVSSEELIALHRDQGIPVNELAKLFNVNRWTIYRKLREGSA